jgi:hypothetical protein
VTPDSDTARPDAPTDLLGPGNNVEIASSAPSSATPGSSDQIGAILVEPSVPADGSISTLDDNGSPTTTVSAVAGQQISLPTSVPFHAGGNKPAPTPIPSS